MQKKIIIGKVVEIKPDYIIVKWKNKEFICKENEVSDYKVNLFTFFSLNTFYKFCLFNEKEISYKAIRPKLIRNKRITMHTISGSKNLEKYLLEVIKNED